MACCGQGRRPHLAPRAAHSPASSNSPEQPPAPGPEAPQPLPLHRRSALLSGVAVAGAPLAAAAAASTIPPPPAEVGEVGGTLNDCGIDSISCASSMSDDVRFFYNPWEYEGGRAAAIEKLIQVLTVGSRHTPRTCKLTTPSSPLATESLYHPFKS